MRYLNFWLHSIFSYFFFYFFSSGIYGWNSGCFTAVYKHWCISPVCFLFSFQSAAVPFPNPLILSYFNHVPPLFSPVFYLFALRSATPRPYGPPPPGAGTVTCLGSGAWVTWALCASVGRWSSTPHHHVIVSAQGISSASLWPCTPVSVAWRVQGGG